MKLITVLSTLLSTFATGTIPNLCDDVFVDDLGVPLSDDLGQTLSRYCVWTGPDAPIWNADVCCTIDNDSAACSVPKSGGCPTNTKRMYCEHGAANAVGGVVCYQPFPDACEAGLCVRGPDVPPPVVEFLLCCSPGGVCQYIEASQGFDCPGQLGWCDYGYMDGNGVVECWD